MGQWSAQTDLSGSGVYVQKAVFATSPGGRAIVNWITGNTALAADSYTEVRPSGKTFGAAAHTGSVSSANGAYILEHAAAGADGTLAVAVTDRVYSTATAFTETTAVDIASPTATALGGALADPAATNPQSLGAGGGGAIVGTVLATYGAGKSGYPSSYSASQRVVTDIIRPKSATVAHQLGSSSGYYDGNGGDGCPCLGSPPVASITGAALDPAGNGVAVGQLSPGGVLESARYVVASANAPAAPGSVKAVAGASKVTLSWKAPASNGGSPITGYDVYEGSKPGHEATKPVNAKPLSSATRSFAVTKLKQHAKYYFVVKAANAIGMGQASKEVSATPT
jgi:hypothetical protein